MRWRALFDDLEAQLAAAQAAELTAELADRSRLAAARVRLTDRLGAAAGAELAVDVPGLGTVRGLLRDTGEDWLLLEEGGGRESLVPLTAVMSLRGLPRGEVPAQDGAAGTVARALDLRWALRSLVRDRAGVVVVLRDGGAVAGTLDRVGADHLDVAEHPPGEPRRAGVVRGVRVVPLAAVVAVRSG